MKSDYRNWVDPLAKLLVLVAIVVFALSLVQVAAQVVPLEVIALFLAVFAVVGFMRGARAEAWVTAVILIAFTIQRIWGDTLIMYTNRIYKLNRFALAGGIITENPQELWQRFADEPPLIESDIEKVVFRIALFLLIYLLGPIIGRTTVQRNLAPVSFQLLHNLPDLGERFLGAVLGSVNGFLIAFFILPRILPHTILAEITTIPTTPPQSSIPLPDTRTIALTLQQAIVITVRNTKLIARSVMAWLKPLIVVASSITGMITWIRKSIQLLAELSDVIELPDNIKRLSERLRGEPKEEDAITQLERLVNLKEQGVLTEKEFLVEKKEILGS